MSSAKSHQIRSHRAQRDYKHKCVHPAFIAEPNEDISLFKRLVDKIKQLINNLFHKER